MHADAPASNMIMIRKWHAMKKSRVHEKHWKTSKLPKTSWRHKHVINTLRNTVIKGRRRIPANTGHTCTARKRNAFVSFIVPSQGRSVEWNHSLVNACLSKTIPSLKLGPFKTTLYTTNCFQMTYHLKQQTAVHTEIRRSVRSAIVVCKPTARRTGLQFVPMPAAHHTRVTVADSEKGWKRHPRLDELREGQDVLCHCRHPPFERLSRVIHTGGYHISLGSWVGWVGEKFKWYRHYFRFDQPVVIRAKKNYILA